MPRDNLTLKIIIYNKGDHCTVVTRVWHIIPCKYEYGILYRGNGGIGMSYHGNDWYGTSWINRHWNSIFFWIVNHRKVQTIWCGCLRGFGSIF